MSKPIKLPLESWPETGPVYLLPTKKMAKWLTALKAIDRTFVPAKRKRLYRGKILLRLWSVDSSTDSMEYERDHVLCICWDWSPIRVKSL